MNSNVVFCGAFGSVASIVGKIALSDNWLVNTLRTYLCDNTVVSCYIIEWPIRAIIFALMFSCNALMISNFLKALEKNGSLQVTVMSSSINFVLTGLLGTLVMNETVSLMWYVGALMVSVGIYLVSLSQMEDAP